MFGFALAPVGVGETAEVFFNVVVNRDAFKADDGDFFEFLEKHNYQFN